MYKNNLIKHSRNQIIIFIYITLSIFILYRYFFLQIIEYQKYSEAAGNNSLRKIVLYPPRGIIYDRNYKPIVDNNPLYQMKIIAKDMQDNFNYHILEKYTSISKVTIDSVILESRKIGGGQFKPMLVKNYINNKTKSILDEYKLDLKGIYFSQLPARIYTSNCNLTHVLGYLKKVDKDFLEKENYHINDIVGFNGVEKYYEEYLHGDYGVDYFVVDRFGVMQGKHNTGNDILPIQGEDLVLTINSDIQNFVENSFQEYKGSVIIMDPSNGEIISLMSKPDYNLNSFIGFLSNEEWSKLQGDSDSPLVNRAIQSNYPPGSIFKLVLSAIAIEKNIVDKNWKVNCDGEYPFHDTVFRCWKEDGHGEVNLNGAIKSSCNIYFYNLMQKIEFNDWTQGSKEFGFGIKTDIDLPRENKGLVPDKNYMNNFYKKKGGWSKGHLLNLSIGQGEVSTTPIQIIQLINYIANDGIAYKPHLNVGSELHKEEISYKQSVWPILRKAMYDAVNSEGGTAYNARIDKQVGIAYGKTGTAQVCSNCDIKPHGWFAGFIELRNGKKYSICIIIENGGKGSDKPARIAKDIFQYIIGVDSV